MKKAGKLTTAILILCCMMLFCSTEAFADYKYEPIEDCIDTVNGISGNGNYFPLTQEQLTAVERVLEFDNDRSTNGSQNVTGIKFDKSTIVMAVGDISDALIATLNPQNGLGGRLTWHSSDTSVITVDRSGKITAKGTGHAAAFSESENGIITVCGVYVLPYTEISQRLELTSKAYEYEVGSQFSVLANYSGYFSQPDRIAWTVSGDISAVRSEIAIYGWLNYNDSFVYKGTSYKYSYKQSTIADALSYTALNPGTIVITGKNANGAQDSVTITIKPKDTGVTVSPSKADMKVGESLSLTAEVTPSNAFNKSVTWTSSDNSIATVNSYGLVKAAGKGTAIITATSANGFTATSEITVADAVVAVKQIVLSPTSKTIQIGDTFAVSAQVLPDNASNKTLSWSSSNKSVAAVDSAGNVKGIAEGTAVITATAHNGVSNSITVCVEHPTAVITLNTEDKVYLDTGEYLDLSYSVSPSSEAAYVSVYTNNSDAVSISGNRIYGKKFGYAYVYIKPKNGTAKTVTVYVKPSKSEQEAYKAELAEEILYYVNIERSNEGLAALTTNPELMALAQIRAEECTVQFSHTRPDGTQWYTVFDNYSHYATTMGENIIYGSGSTAEEFVEGWMNSEGHRKNILAEKFNTTGIGVILYYDYYNCKVYLSYSAQLFTGE